MSLIAADAVLIDHFTKVDPTLVSGPLRKAAAKYGAGLLVEEGTVNLLINPSVEGDAGTNLYAYYLGNSIALEQSADRAYIGDHSLKVTYNGAGAAGPYLRSSSVSLQEGRTYTMSAYVFPEGFDLTVNPQYENSSTIGGDYPPNLCKADRWTRVSCTFTASANSASGSGAGTFYSSAAVPNGSVAYFDAFQLEEKAYATEYVDGSLGTGFAWDQTVNLISNPSFETDTAGWTGIGENLISNPSIEIDTSRIDALDSAAVVRTTAQALDGAASLQYTVGGFTGGVPNRSRVRFYGTDDGGYQFNQNCVVQFVAHVRANNTPRKVRLEAVWYSPSGWMGSDTWGTSVADRASGWKQVTLQATPPLGATYVQLDVAFLDSAVGEIHYIDAVGMFALPLISGDGINIFDNSDFENGIEGWASDIGAPTLSIAEGYYGHNSLRLTTTAGGDAGAYTSEGRVQVRSGTTYTLSYRVRSSDARSAYVDIGAGSWLVTQAGGQTALTPNQWTYKTITITPTDSGLLTIFFHNWTATGGVGQTIDIDAVKLEVGSTATPFVPRQYSNLILDPQGTHYADASYWTAGQSPGVNLQLVADASAGQPVGSNTIKSTILAAHTAGQFDFYGVWTHIKSTVAERTVTASAWIKTTAGYKIGLRIIGENDTATYYGGSTSDIQTVVNASGDWQRISVTLPAFAGATGAQLRLGLEGSDAPPVGTVCWITGVQLVQGYDPLPYTDGSLGAGYSWDASENLIDADTSTVEGGVGTWRNLGAAPAFERYTGWSHNGAWSVLYPWGTTNEYAWFPVLCASNTNYALSFWLYNDGVGPTNNRFRIEFYDSVGTGLGSTPYVLSTEISNWRRQVVQVITPPNAVNFRVVFHNESMENQQFFVDDFQVEQRAYATPYGSTGTANATTSTVKVPWGLVSQTAITRRVDGGALGTQYYLGTPDSWNAHVLNPNLYGQGGSYKATGLAPNTTYTFSAYLWANTGSLAPGYLMVDGPAVSAPLVSITLTNPNFVRVAITFTTNSTGGTVYLRGVFGVTTANPPFNNFVGIDAVQLEQRAYATPYGSTGAPNTTSSSRVSSVVTFTSEYKVSGSFSVATWFKATRDFTNLHTDFNALFALYHGADQVLSFEDAGSGYIMYVRNSANGASQMTNPILGNVKKGDLVFLAVTFDGVTCTTYHSVNDGPLVNDGSGNLVGSEYPYMDSLDLGSRYANGPASIGLVWDQFLICDSVLSLNEITKLAFAPSRPTEQDNYRVVFSLDPVAIQASVLATTGNTERALMATQVNVETVDGPIFNQYPSRLDVLTDRAVFNVEDELYLQGYCDRYVVNSIAPDEAGLTRYSLVAAQS